MSNPCIIFLRIMFQRFRWSRFLKMAKDPGQIVFLSNLITLAPSVSLREKSVFIRNTQNNSVLKKKKEIEIEHNKRDKIFKKL